MFWQKNCQRLRLAFVSTNRRQSLSNQSKVKMMFLSVSRFANEKEVNAMWEEWIEFVTPHFLQMTTSLVKWNNPLNTNVGEWFALFMAWPYSWIGYWPGLEGPGLEVGLALNEGCTLGQNLRKGHKLFNRLAKALLNIYALESKTQKAQRENLKCS